MVKITAIRHVRGFDVARPVSIGVMLGFMLPLVFLPLISIFVYGTRHGLGTFWSSLTATEAIFALKLSLVTSFWATIFNVIFGIFAAYVLSPKLLERRGVAGDVETVARDRTRTRASSRVAAAPVTCPSSSSPMIDQAAIQLDGDWAEVSVPRCSGGSAGTDEFRLIYFEERWRFIYTDLFEAPTNVSTGR